MAKGRIGSFIAIAIALLAMVLAGCGKSGTAVRPEDIIQSAIEAESGITSSHIEASAIISMQGPVQGVTQIVDLNGTASGDADWPNQKIKAHGEVTIQRNAVPFVAKADLYAVDNYSYQQITVFGTTENWTKSPLPATFWAVDTSQYLTDSLLQYADLPESLPDDQANGVDCYVVRFAPDLSAIQGVLQQQFPQEHIPALADFVKSATVRAWIAKDTYFVSRIELSATATITQAQWDVLAAGEQLESSLLIVLNSTNINQPVDITLPPEAANAP